MATRENLDLEVYEQESFIFNRFLVAPTEEIIKLRNFIMIMINLRTNNEFIIARYKKCLDLILMNLYVAAKNSVFLRLSMDEHYYLKSKFGVISRQASSYKKIKFLIEKLHDLKFIRIYKGFPGVPYNSKTGKTTRILILDKLKNLFDLENSNWSFCVDDYTVQNVIVRNENKKTIQLKMTSDQQDKFNQILKLVDRLNILHHKTLITLEVPLDRLSTYTRSKLDNFINISIIKYQINHIKDILGIYKNIFPIDVKFNNQYTISPKVVKELYTIYIDKLYKYQYILYNTTSTQKNIYNKLPTFVSIQNNYENFEREQNKKLLIINAKTIKRIFFLDLERGGRYYGPCYQRSNAQLRKYLKIDGEETVEIDYSAMHLRMLYHFVGIEYKDDPFKLDNREYRKFIKTVGYIALNADSRKAAMFAVKASFAKMGVTITLIAAGMMLDKFCERHKPISKYFFNSVWANLHYYESTIVSNILEELLDQDIVALPIHDSLIVQKRHESLLRKLMIEKYRNRLPFDPLL
jgi:hypothetical protein